jgi:hypothetical protein
MDGLLFYGVGGKSWVALELIGGQIYGHLGNSGGHLRILATNEPVNDGEVNVF